jgi:hypothetical protein
MRRRNAKGMLDGAGTSAGTLFGRRSPAHSAGEGLPLWQSGDVPLTFISLIGRAWLDMDENRCREVSARPSVPGRDKSCLEPTAGEGESSVSADSLLRRKARAAIRAGMLPSQHQVSVWGGPGSGASCAVCGDMVPQDGLGFEMEFRDVEGRPELRQVHIPCFAAWDLECRAFLQADGNGVTIPDRERVEP